MNISAREKAREAFVTHFGEEPQGVAFAPGRVNLIGDHVDYNDGLVLPMPLAQGTAVAWAPAGQEVEAIASDASGETDSFRLSDIPGPDGSWRSYLRGMAAIMPEFGLPVPGMRLAIAGDLPRGTGLSSSASLEIALARAFAQAAGNKNPGAVAMAQAGQQTEHRYAGVQCGIMDQMASAAGISGHATLLDCRDLSVEHIALPDDWAVLIVQSNVTRGLVDGEYNLRRQQCETAAKALGLASLREAGSKLVTQATLDPVVKRRARHVVEETDRTRQAAICLAAGDLSGFGAILNQSHASLRDLFEVSHPAVDNLVTDLQTLIGGRGGARMTGGGFGGAVVAVMESAALDPAIQALQQQRRAAALPCDAIIAWSGRAT